MKASRPPQHKRKHRSLKPVCYCQFGRRSQLAATAQSAFRGQALIGSLRQERSLLVSTSAKPSYQHLTAGVLDLRYSIGTMPTLEESLSHADFLVLIATGLIGCASRIAFPTRRAAAYFD